MEKILEIFNQVKINVPLLDAIQQVPSYAKLLKDRTRKEKPMSLKGLPSHEHQQIIIWAHSC